MIDRIGRDKWMNLPHWKQEGMPEYVANISLIRNDNLLTLYDRIEILNHDEAWDDTFEWDRIHFKAWLMVEYLMEIKQNSLDEIISDTVLGDVVFSEMLAWYNRR